MYSSIYNGKKLETKHLIYTNSIRYYHFSTTVRTPPNKYTNIFIGELKKHIKPKFDATSINFYKKNIKDKSDISTKKNLKDEKISLPIILLNKNNANNNISLKKKKVLLSNDCLNSKIGNGIIDLNFPYCKPNLRISNSNLDLIYKDKNKYLNNNENKKLNLKKTYRLYNKSLTNIHQIINKSKNYKLKL